MDSTFTGIDADTDTEQPAQTEEPAEQYATFEDDEDRAKKVKAGPPRKHVNPITGKVFLFYPLTGGERDACIKQARGRDGNSDPTELEFYAVNKATVHPTKVTRRWWGILGQQEAGVRQALVTDIFEASGMAPGAEGAAKNGSTPEGES